MENALLYFYFYIYIFNLLIFLMNQIYYMCYINLNIEIEIYIMTFIDYFDFYAINFYKVYLCLDLKYIYSSLFENLK